MQLVVREVRAERHLQWASKQRVAQQPPATVLRLRLLALFSVGPELFLRLRLVATRLAELPGGAMHSDELHSDALRSDGLHCCSTGLPDGNHRNGDLHGGASRNAGLKGSNLRTRYAC